MTEKDLIIIGAGPAGSTAAIYATRAGIKPLIIAGAAPGGQLLMTHEIENFPGFPEPLSGYELMDRMHRQCKRLGAEISTEEAASADFSGGRLVIGVGGGQTYSAKSVIVATGARARWLGIPSEARFIGKGASTCATCDGFFHRGGEVCVAGGGAAAVGDALYLAGIAAKVTLIHRRDELRASAALAARARANPKINFVWNSVVSEFCGDESLAGVKVKNVKTGEIKDIPCSGMFVAIGHDPNAKLFAGQLKTDENGYIVTDGRTRTSVPGVFAAGDVMDVRYKQAVTSAGTGCMAALEAEHFLLTKI